jgi:hypothetical protein
LVRDSWPIQDFPVRFATTSIVTPETAAPWEKTVKDVQGINSDIISQVDKTVAQLKMIQAGSTIILAGAVIVYSGGTLGGAAWATTSTAGFLGAATAGKIGATYLGYELSVAVAKTWGEGENATAIAVGKEVAEEVGEEAGKLLDNSGQANLAKSSAHAKKVAVLEKKIANQQKKLASIKSKKAAGQGKLPKSAQKRLSNRAKRSRTKLSGYKKGVKVSKQATSKKMGYLKRGAGGILQIVFAANDIREAVMDFSKAFNDYQKADESGN